MLLSFFMGEGNGLKRPIGLVMVTTYYRSTMLCGSLWSKKNYNKKS